MLEQLVLGSFKLDTPGYIHDGERHLSLSTLVLSVTSAGFEPLLEKSLMSATYAFTCITGALLSAFPFAVCMLDRFLPAPYYSARTLCGGSSSSYVVSSN